MKYEYWLNGDFENRMTRELTQISDTLSLVALLPVDTLPIRSSCFQFQPNGDNPIIYAKNDIRFRFWTTDLRFTDTLAYFIDMNVSDTILADTIERNTTKKFIETDANGIKWYKLYAEFGDSLMFKTDKQCNMDLFAPSGNKVFSSSNSRSLVFTGCHAWENGTYYLAVHDVSSNNSDSTTVFYRHIYKYALLAYTPEYVGNRIGNSFIMDLFGNGLDSLESITLTRLNDTLRFERILSTSLSHACVRFNLYDSISIGLYDLWLTFKNGEETDSILWANAVMMEELNNGSLLVRCSNPSQMARPYPITITVENTGNIDRVYVPFNIAFTRPDVVRGIEFENFSIVTSEHADSSGYKVVTLTENLFNNGELGGVIFLYLPIIKAYETQTYKLKFDLPNGVNLNLYAWTGQGCKLSDYVSMITENHLETMRMQTLASNENVDNVYYAPRSLPQAENVLELGENIQNLMDNATEPWNYTGQITNTAIKIGVTLAGIQNGLGHRIDQAVCEAYGIEPWDPLYDQIMQLHPPVATPGQIIGGDLGMFVDNLLGIQRQCVQRTTPDPGTPFNIRTVNPVDPNEIYGYTSESGSIYMRQNIQDVVYEIEFENDTALSTSAAHRIVIQDTLDGRVFDLSSFKSQSISIGNRIYPFDGEQSVVQTIDLRPEMDALALVQLEYDQNTGIAKWTLTSLDPMTMEPTTDTNRGVLPINYSGNGIGRVEFKISLKDIFEDGKNINNQASIVFDSEEPILTPIWTNIIDAYPPQSFIDTAIATADSLTIYFNSSDNRSGVWHHTLYYRNASTNEWKILANQIIDNHYTLELAGIQSTEFLVVATDSAGNKEGKLFNAEYLFEVEPVIQYNVIATTTQMNCNVLGSGRYKEHTDVIIQAIEAEGYHFVRWNDGNTENPRSVYLIQDTIFVAEFLPNIYSVITESNDIVAGQVNGGGNYDYQTIVILTAFPNNGYHFVNWSDGNTENPRTVMVESNITYTAVFAPNIYSVTAEVQNSSMGSVNGGGSYNYNSNVTLTAVPNSCSRFVSWTDGNTENPRTITVVSDTTLTAMFERVDYAGSITAAICEGSTYAWNGSDISEAGTYTQTLQAVNGCDSTVTLTLSVNPVASTTLSATICEGSVYTENGFNASEAGTYTQTLQTINGCDSIVTLTLTVNPVANTTLSAAICEGSVYTENGFNVSEAGTHTLNLQTINGCDSIITLTLTVNPVESTNLTAVICDGTTYVENGFNVSEAGTYTQTLQTVNGCDSVVTLTLTVNPTYNITIDASINEGETYEENGFSESEAGTYVHTLQSEFGCDSVITLNLTVNSYLTDVVANTIEVSLYPNPANAYTMLKVEGLKEQTTVYLFDIQGRKLKEYIMNIGQQTSRIELGDLPKGVYTIMLGNTTKKLIVE